MPEKPVERAGRSEGMFDMSTTLLLPAAISFVVVSLASYTDLKKRVISNRLTYPAIAFGVVFYAVLGVLRWDPFLAISGALGASVAFAVGYIMWVTHSWAGGDVKLLTALGAMLPFYGSAPYPFSITVLLNGILVTTPVLAVYLLLCRVRNHRAKREFSFAPSLAAGTFAGVIFGDLFWKMLIAVGGGP